MVLYLLIFKGMAFGYIQLIWTFNTALEASCPKEFESFDRLKTSLEFYREKTAKSWFFASIPKWWRWKRLVPENSNLFTDWIYLLNCGFYRECFLFTPLQRSGIWMFSSDLDIIWIEVNRILHNLKDICWILWGKKLPTPPFWEGSRENQLLAFFSLLNPQF